MSLTNPDPENVITKSIVVEQGLERTFRVWTEQIRQWWPAGHSISGDPATQVFIEGRVGGRFYERASDGVEYNWGRVTAWEPPQRLAYTWYLGSSRELPTQVTVQFIPIAETQTRVEVEHRGPELVGELWWATQGRFRTAWDSVLAAAALFLKPSRFL